MRAVLTRVSSASVTVEGEVVGAIDCPETGGLLALVGVAREDCDDASTLASKIDKMADKISGLRILDGEVAVRDAGAPVLLVSQFTLYGRTAKGRRPSWSDAAPGEDAEPVIEALRTALEGHGVHVETGRFGAMMEVTSVNQGPFTVLVEC
ncbi:D-tyrosyl-tRNA(Tyr) deacylase [Corynebacterium sp. CMW7794]|uniref:D-aminoacyl-tRNA deacylase n=1 Tax=Corynebacterium TaxID=1716 RepID=UPI000795B99D|nr:MULTISPECIES: D-aminoacyl-tRNA deacylase [Corynebacterium]KXB55854.1 D-tyrosyl-tRNA(Tyr) deacylase [Corynebacterium sp. DNF00584]KXI19294.1 D-tyrosyl-tRNA(Tyr) deacylase [Corynebacterium sp. CMW7794]MCQ9349169.1 D-aminoacyl-tRNA deacylase [Corynebacterium phoceense]OFL76801.1 D-tyrosyl-tRNA(Tyr) deacylase [Corynebacterium sp. HMSC077B05]OFN39553.1 D-tyrosyl-tRNA(Tyr) deacylase [Corynebacterium sp. HMSC072G08]